jgi:hypothetical protein
LGELSQELDFAVVDEGVDQVIDDSGDGRVQRIDFRGPERPHGDRFGHAVTGRIGQV